MKNVVVLDHISVRVRDLDAAREFYEKALGAIGMKINMDVKSAFGMGSKKEKIFWLERDKKARGGGHYALRVDAPEDVDAFHRAAMKAGGKENGKPGPRPNYGPHYYAAFVKDHEGNNIEVVCYAAQKRLAVRGTAKRGAAKRGAVTKRMTAGKRAAAGTRTNGGSRTATGTAKRAGATAAGTRAAMMAASHGKRGTGGSSRKASPRSATRR